MKKLILIAALALGAAACTMMPVRSQGISASLVDFLYPEGGDGDDITEARPHLQVPLTVGLAFVPAKRACGPCEGPSAALQAWLLERVRARFADRNYIREIRVIPEAYLRQGEGGFTLLEQLSRLYGFDVIALVSYDQVAASGIRESSLLYWTIVGSYVIKGNTNDVHTFVDTAVLDVKTHKLLLRAPGVDVRSFNATLARNSRELADQSDAALGAATDQMIAHLDSELGVFRERIRTDNSVIVTQRAFAGGGGGAGAFGGLALGALALGAWARRRAARH